MKKLLFVAFIGALVACGEATTETTTVDSAAAVVDSAATMVVDSAATVVDSAAAAVVDSAAAAVK